MSNDSIASGPDVHQLESCERSDGIPVQEDRKGRFEQESRSARRQRRTNEKQAYERYTAAVEDACERYRSLSPVVDWRYTQICLPHCMQKASSNRIFSVSDLPMIDISAFVSHFCFASGVEEWNRLFRGPSSGMFQARQFIVLVVRIQKNLSCWFVQNLLLVCAKLQILQILVV